MIERALVAMLMAIPAAAHSQALVVLPDAADPDALHFNEAFIARNKVASITGERMLKRDGQPMRTEAARYLYSFDAQGRMTYSNNSFGNPGSGRDTTSVSYIYDSAGNLSERLDLFFKMLEVEPITNPDFCYKGEIIGIIGNLQAYREGKRYIKKDINRSWLPEIIHNIQTMDKSRLLDEDFEIRDILDIIDEEIARVNPDELYLLDLHTTSSDGGIFCIATNEKKSNSYST